MRVSQLARRLNILPADVLAALPEGSVEAAGTHNARLSDTQVEEVVRFFRPDNWQELLNEMKETPAEEPAEASHAGEPAKSGPVAADGQTNPLAGPAISGVAPVQEFSPLPETEVIRAPKVELPGLRIVGKIPLPEKKPRQNIPEQKPGPTPRKGQQGRSQKHRQAKNPVALERERALREADRLRKQRAEQEKKKKTERYLRKIAEQKALQVQRMRTKTKEGGKPTEVSTSLPVYTKSSWWQRFKKWLFRE